MIGIRTIPNVMRYFDCTAEDAARYIDLRDEGYGAEQAELIAGLSDPPDDISERQMQDQEQPDPPNPVAWVRVHPDGTYTDEYLPDRVIERVRKESGAWVPLVAMT